MRLQEKVFEPSEQQKVLLTLDVATFKERPQLNYFERAIEVVASLAVGTENLFAARVTRQFPADGYTEVDLGGTTVEVRPVPAEPGAKVALALQAEDVILSLRPVRDTSARNVLAGTVSAMERCGGAVVVQVETPVTFRALITPASAHELEILPGRQVYLLVKVSAFRLLV